MPCRMRKNSLVLVIVTISILIGLVYYAEPGMVEKKLTEVNLFFFMLAVVIYLITLIIKIYRWYIIVHSIHPSVRFWKVASIYVMGLSTNNATPGGFSGEPLKIYLLHADYGITSGEGLATIFAEKTLDLIILTLLSITGFILLILVFDYDSSIQVIQMLSVIIILMITGLVVALHPKSLHSIISGIHKVLSLIISKKRNDSIKGKLDNIASKFQSGIRQITSFPRIYLLSIFLTFAIWIFAALRLYTILLALGISVSLATVLIVACFTFVFGKIIPGGGGNIATISAILSSMGIEISNAVSVGILEVLTSIVISFILGFAAVITSGIEIKRDEHVYIENE